MPTWLLSPVVLKGVALLAAVLILLGLKHGYDERRRDEGRAELQPKIVALSQQKEQAIAANGVLRKDVDDLRGRYNDLFKEGQDRQARSAAAIAKATKDAVAAKAEIDRLSGIVNRPKSTEACDGICARAYKLLGDLIAGSLQPDSP